MQKRFFAFLAACLTALACAHGTQIKVVTWNIEYLASGRAPTEKRAGQMALAQKVLDGIKPDILLTQEVRDWPTVKELVSGLSGVTADMVSKFPIASPYQRGTQEQAIASRFPVDSAWFASWKVDGEFGPPRGYSFAALKLAEDQFLLVYSLHLKANGRGSTQVSISEREESARQLAEHIRAMKELYGKRGKVAVLVAGDFNTNPDDPLFKDEKTLPILEAVGLRWCWKGVPMEKRITIPAVAPFPDNCFDQILFDGLELTKVSVADGQKASDHEPVEAVFEIASKS